MSEQGEKRARRALPPRDDNPADAPTAPPASVGRRGVAASRGQRAESAPVSPAGGVAAGGGRGRRFADTNDAPASGPSPEATGWGRRRLRLGIVTAVALALVFGGAWGAQRLGVFDAASSSSTPSADAARFVAAPEDLSSLNAQAQWQIATTTSTLDATTPQAKCLTTATEGAERPKDTVVRTFSAGASAPGAAFFQVNHYETNESAHTAYAAFVTQLANCDRTTALAKQGLAVQGLGDEATGQVLEVQDATNEYHTIALTRVGTRVSVLDATQAKSAVAGEAVVATLATVGQRQCTDGGTCPASPTASQTIPLVTTPAGWLGTIDLPRISPGSGAWRATDVADSVTTPGTKCEAVDLGNFPSATTRQQRTYLLRDDTAAPQSFGVDEAVYTFAKPDEAAAALATLSGNMDGCAARAATAQVTRTGDPSGSGAAASWVVVQRVDQQSATAKFRSAAVVSGTRLIYLVANPSDTFDFSDDAWHALTIRASQRVQQAP
ncbi:hypothetical protein [Propioniciclava flava]